MADDAKAKKIAAARKKLKAYQAREKSSDGSQSTLINTDSLSTLELKLAEAAEGYPVGDGPADIKLSAPSSEMSAASFSKSNTSSFDSETVSVNGTHTQQPLPVETLEHHFNSTSNDLAHTSTIELLINDKASLCSELAHYKAESKEKSLAAEELTVRLHDAVKRIDKLGKDLLSSQSQNAELRSQIEQLSRTVGHSGVEVDKLMQENAELRDHVEELKGVVLQGTERVKVLEDQVKDKECELELSRIRINQISDVASVENDSKVEALTQTKFMHEQQIRDLQAMVQQLETEREQSNQQYQSYVQHLNKEMTSFTERNAKLSEDNNRLAEREQSLVEHVSGLERQLQQLIASQAKQSAKQEVHEETSDKKLLSEEEVDLRIQSIITEKNFLLEKINVQDAQMTDMQKLLNEKLEYIQDMDVKLANYLSLQMDSTKLLEKMEGSSVAASRAVAQNEALKKQLEEVEMKLIQVTNDKVELTNQLDSEKFLNREMRTNYENMEKQIATLSEKLHFKDEEMIRLTNENVELNSKIENLRNEHSSHVDVNHGHIDGANSREEHEVHDHKHDHSVGDSGIENHEHSHDHSCDHDSQHNHSHNHEDTMDGGYHHNHSHTHSHGHNPVSEESSSKMLPFIPQSEAMQKLETRFKALMNDVANLTDEKQRLEHLVLQLQGETDTIGEYISLYQAQRRVLKQREIEKNNQLTKLKSEREELHSKLALLNQLVGNLSLQVGANTTNNNINMPSHQADVRTTSFESSSSDSTTASSLDSVQSQIMLEDTKQLDSNQIIHAIQNIVENIKNTESTEFDLNAVTALDHCSCCSGKFETI